MTKLENDLGFAEEQFENHDEELNMSEKSCNDQVAKALKEVHIYRNRSAKSQKVFAVTSKSRNRERKREQRRYKQTLMPSMTG